jgi:hypothetical protein
MTCEVPISKTDQFCGPAVPKFTEPVDALLTLVGALLAPLGDVLLVVLGDVLLVVLADVLLVVLGDVLLVVLADVLLTLLVGAVLTLVEARLPSNSLRGTEKAINGPEPKKA